MTIEIFEEYVRLLDQKFAAGGRKVLFVIGNCPAHGGITNLKAIKIVFLPANTSAITQPIDDGVILQTRKIYRQHLLKRILLCYDNGKQYSVDILGAICLIVYASKELKATTIRCCFKHAEFRKQHREDLDDACSSCCLDDEGDSMCARITDSRKEDDGRLGFAKYSNVEAHVQTMYADVEDEITDSVPVADDSNDNEFTQAPTLVAVIDSVTIVHSFIECSGGDFDMLRVMIQLENMPLGVANYRAKLSRIRDYFT